MMLEMAKSDEYIMQLVASEAIIAAAQKKKDTNLVIFNLIVFNYPH